MCVRFYGTLVVRPLTGLEGWTRTKMPPDRMMSVLNFKNSAKVTQGKKVGKVLYRAGSPWAT